MTNPLRGGVCKDTPLSHYKNMERENGMVELDEIKRILNENTAALIELRDSL